MKYLYAGALALFLCLGLLAYYQSARIDTLKSLNKVLNDRIELSEAARKKEQQDTIDANNRRGIYETDLNTKEQELAKLRANLASGASRVSIRAQCPVSSTSPSSAGSTATVAQLDPAAEQAYLDLRASIVANESKCEYFRQEAIAR